MAAPWEQDYRYLPFDPETDIGGFWPGGGTDTRDFTSPPATPPPAEGPGDGGGNGGAGGWQQWLDILNNQFFPEWAKGGYGYDPNWVRLQQTQGEDLINEWANRATEQANLNLVGTGRFYSPGPRQGMYRDIEEQRMGQIQNLGSDIATKQLESQFAGRQAWINALLNYIGGQQQYGVGMAGVGAQQQGQYMNLLANLLGMM